MYDLIVTNANLLLKFNLRLCINFQPYIRFYREPRHIQKFALATRV